VVQRGLDPLKEPIDDRLAVLGSLLESLRLVELASANLPLYLVEVADVIQCRCDQLGLDVFGFQELTSRM
jgi:hypothetical protein